MSEKEKDKFHFEYSKYIIICPFCREKIGAETCKSKLFKGHEEEQEIQVINAIWEEYKKHLIREHKIRPCNNMVII